MDVKIMHIRTFCESLSPIFMLMRKHIICYSFDTRTYIRDLKSGKIFRNIATKYWHSYRIDISPDCKILAISDYLGSETYLFNIQTATVIPLTLQNDARVTAMHFTPDSKYLITGCESLTLQVNNVQQGNQVIGAVMSHDDTIVQISTSMDQEQIISISQDGIMRKWSFQTHKQLGEDVLLFNRTGAVKCTYDGQYIALVEHQQFKMSNSQIQPGIALLLQRKQLQQFPKQKQSLRQAYLGNYDFGALIKLLVMQQIIVIAIRSSIMIILLQVLHYQKIKNIF